MRILLANKFYYRRGGDCIYTMNLEQMLKKHGHEVAVFAMQYPLNEPSRWSEYWPSEMSRLKAFTRPFGDGEVRRKFTKLLDDFKPEVLHLNNIHTQLSPLIAELAHERSIRVVWTLHDTKLVCPCYTCQRNGRECEECFTDKKAVMRHSCMNGGIVGSVVGYYEQKRWDKQRLQTCTDVFIAPSEFMKQTMVRGGYKDEKIKVLSNFVDAEKVMGASCEKGDYYVYLGRVTAVKGIRTLCQVAQTLPYPLKVIGEGDLYTQLSADAAPHIEFMGQKEWAEIRPVLERARFMVLPAEWSENNPLSVIESLSLGTPVLGARIGGIPELIREGECGMTFTSGDEADLKEKIQLMWNASFDYHAIARDAVLAYADKAYYDALMKVYSADECPAS